MFKHDQFHELHVICNSLSNRIHKRVWAKLLFEVRWPDQIQRDRWYYVRQDILCELIGCILYKFFGRFINIENIFLTESIIMLWTTFFLAGPTAEFTHRHRRERTYTASRTWTRNVVNVTNLSDVEEKFDGKEGACRKRMNKMVIISASETSQISSAVFILKLWERQSEQKFSLFSIRGMYVRFATWSTIDIFGISFLI